MPVTPVPIAPSGATHTIATVSNEILVTLGQGSSDTGVQVELHQTHLTQAIKDAVRLINQYRPPRTWASLAYASGTVRYALSHTGIIGVTDVGIFNENRDCDPGCVLNVFPFAPAGLSGIQTQAPAYPAFTQVFPGDTLSDRLNSLAYMDYASLLSGTVPGWTARRESSGIALYVIAGTGAKVMYEYSWALTADDVAATGLPALTRPSDVQWLKDFATAKAKQILGLIRRKHGGVVMPGGSTEPMDGESLVQEGITEQQALEEMIRRRRRPSLPFRA